MLTTNHLLRVFYILIIFSAVVHESSVLGSDGESLEVSPSTSDQTPTGTASRYIVNVKMRPKPTRKWSEVSDQF